MSVVDDPVALVVAGLVLVGLLGLGVLVAVMVAAGPNEKHHDRGDKDSGPGG